MHADRYFAIGTTHPICQDYAIANNLSGKTSVYLADGCSSSPATDFGARFLTLAAMRHERGAVGWDKATITAASWMANAAQLPPRCLDATLLGIERDGQDLIAFAYGDGVIAFRERDTGVIVYHHIECADGAPDYLNYHLNPMRMDTYVDHMRGVGEGAKIVTRVRDGEVIRIDPYPILEPYIAEIPEYVDLVAVMSDGAASFQKLEGGSTVSIPVGEVVNQVMAIKNTTGDFVVRRVRNGFLNRFCKKNGWTHYDDFAVGMVHIPEVAEPPKGRSRGEEVLDG